MREKVAAILEEVKRLRRAGVSALPVSDEALARLRTALAAAEPAQNEAASVAERDRNAGAGASGIDPEKIIDSRFRGSTGSAAARGFQEMYAQYDRRTAPANDDMRKKTASSTAGSAAAARNLPPPPEFTLPEGSKRERWEWLRDRVLNCPVCQAHTHGDHKVVFGVGNIDADIFFCGEAPGAEEEEQGEPFVGRAGQLLNKMIAAMGLKREDVYIGNILNWRPEMEGRLSGTAIRQVGNRPPTAEEMAFCLPYLRAQVEVVQPRVIVALGATAARGLLGFDAFKSLGEVRGRWHAFNGIPLMVTYHPSYLLRNASNRTKRTAWEDLLQVMERVGLPISEKQRRYFL